MSIKLVIADDHAIFREGFKLLLRNQENIEVVGEAADGSELLDVVRREVPDLVITDIKMPEMDGIQACKAIRKEYPEIRVIALSMFNDDNLIVDMLEAGATGYLLKNTNKRELLEACICVDEGGHYYSAATSQKLTRLIADSKVNPFRSKSLPSLTPRELEIVQLIAEQLTNKEIADRLNLSIRTIESHREKIQEKTGARNMVGVVIFAIRHRLIEI